MKCEACGCEDRWIHEYVSDIIEHPTERRIKFSVCECGHEQEMVE